MSSAVAPEDPHQRPQHDPDGTDNGTKQAATTLKQVISCYNARLASARRSPGDGGDLVGAWLTARDDAVDELDRLETADADETARIATRYAARLKQLRDDR
ncbi:hypothetical protein [Streptomyces sp. NPDC048603]|uniref:hypothetical protein n=1 Tax=Streptomyces sp. NPDC048603 TaxID=3365577 RepID=UPI003721D8C6